MKSSKKGLYNVILILVVILLVVTPLIFVKNATFDGADGEALGVIHEIAPDYKPWYTPFYEPASGEIESLIFALQAAIGAGVIGFGLGYYKGRKTTEDKSEC